MIYTILEANLKSISNDFNFFLTGQNEMSLSKTFNAMKKWEISFKTNLWEAVKLVMSYLTAFSPCTVEHKCYKNFKLLSWSPCVYICLFLFCSLEIFTIDGKKTIVYNWKWFYINSLKPTKLLLVQQLKMDSWTCFLGLGSKSGIILL